MSTGNKIQNQTAPYYPSCRMVCGRDLTCGKTSLEGDQSKTHIRNLHKFFTYDDLIRLKSVYLNGPHLGLHNYGNSDLGNLMYKKLKLCSLRINLELSTKY